MARSDPQLNVRIPAELRHRLEVSASENGRSVTQELMWHLDRNLPPSLSGGESDAAYTMRVHTAVDDAARPVRHNGLSLSQAEVLRHSSVNREQMQAIANVAARRALELYLAGNDSATEEDAA